MTRPTLLSALLFNAALMQAGAALAGASAWEHVEGGSVRVVTAEAPDASGKLAGALEIRLKPGWKTYWRDPGDAGVPPQVSFRGDGKEMAAEMSFPAPRRFNDGYAVWAGYEADVAFPMVIDLAGAPLPPFVEADIFLGVCETICIPVKASLRIDTASPKGVAEVATAISALPASASASFGATIVAIDDKAMVVEAVVPNDAGGVELYIAGIDTHMLGLPEEIDAGKGKRRFSIPFLTAPDNGTPPAKPFFYTLVTSSGAVSGALQAPVR